ncbi:ABC transporter substrate-binding protein [filamentous cyanobacterium CCP5]|nr:ABC transporter substrate-binding protein [filamentous cyanobacterium CCP5]
MSSTKTITSLAILAASLGLAYAPLPGLQQSITVVSGTELQEPLAVLEERFEQTHPNISLTVEFHGSEDLVNNVIDDRNDFQATVLIPANGQHLEEFAERWSAQNSGEPFYGTPQAIAKTMLVAIAWPERGQALFANGEFDWGRLEEAITKGNWGDLGGNPQWGSFDFVTTDPTRSNSGQLTLSLWSEAKLGSQTLNAVSLNSPPVQALVDSIKQSVYLPPRSTDILLQEFITRGPNDADVATVYESIALHRWEQANATQGMPYQIYYLDSTIETISTAAIVRQGVSRAEAKAGQTLIDFLRRPEQQQVFVQFGFRPVSGDTDIQQVPGSPWAENIPGAEANPTSQIMEPPERELVTDVIRLWQRAN